jgi:twitching motility protein PilT
MGRLDDLLRVTRERGGSDLHLVSGIAPRIRRHGALEPLEGEPALTPDSLSTILRESVGEAQWREFEAGGDLDFALSVPGVARFRGNFLRQEHGPSAVFRTIPEQIATLEELGLPPVLGRLAEMRSGLVLVTGPTGSGKSTTLAAIIDRINRTAARHIVTIEEPVEFVHRGRRSVFSQREVGVDTASFAGALRAAIRQDADVILVGEMRDLETIALALRAAEMGALVFGTLHTNSAAKTIDRLIDVFPADEQPQARLSLSESLAAIVAQLLLPRADGSGRIAVHEILLKTPGLPNLIREGNIPMLVNVMQAGRKDGMQLLDDALADLVERKQVTARDAYLKAQEKSRFEPLIEREQGAAAGAGEAGADGG